MGRRKSKHRKPKIKNKIPAAVSSSSVAPPPWIELPGDVTANILNRLGAEEILKSAQKVCTTWWKVCQDPAMWRVIDLPKRGICPDEHADYAIMCRRAVDRSQGQLVDLTIDDFADDELINYVADRSSLKRITLRCSYHISGMGLTEAVKKLPELEELHLMIMKNVLAVDVKEIGISCPKLKAFSYNEHGSRVVLPDGLQDYDIDGRFYGNDYALAIGKSMPNLRHLALLADGMQNDALQIILDGCPNLESLDIRQCFGLDLGGDLGKRCHEQIKDLRLPSDSVSDIPWLVGETSYSDFCSDFSFGTFDDYEDYEGYERYDDYFSPLGYGFFGDHGPGFFDHDDF
ncbi:hypothetical protein C2S51_005182 [Perilla frutescens var. frutescens]|nr:hypothetical protein C2S51_005182 [Perilla frutescens var. frutescens]